MNSILMSRPVRDLALRALLDGDASSAGIVTDRGGKISRRHYAQRLGINRTYCGVKFAETFADYERQYEIATGPLKHLREMREWLTNAYESRQLGIRAGKVDRVTFQKNFGLKGGTFLSRYPAIRALFQEFDAKADADQYLPADRQEELSRFLTALSRQPVLNKTRLSINCQILAEDAGIPLSRLQDKPFAEALAARESEIRAKAAESRIDPLIHGRVFQFSGLTTLWSTSFLERVGARYKQVAAGMSPQGAKNPHLQLLLALEWIGLSSNPHCLEVVAEAKAKGRITLVDSWEEALYAYRDSLVSKISAGTHSEGSIDNSITALRASLDKLSTGQVVPATSIPLPGIKHARRQMGHLRTVAEAKAKTYRPLRDDYLTFARTRFEDECRMLSLDMGKGESDEFVSVLVNELRLMPELPNDPADGIRRVLKRRLDALQKHAFAIVEHAIEEHQKGSAILATASIRGIEFERAFIEGNLGRYERTELVRSLFPNPKNANAAQVEGGIANLLGLIDQCHSGIPPAGKITTNAYGHFFAKRYLNYGGIAKIRSLLIPSADAVGAALTLYLCESGANVSVGRTLDRDCISSSDLDGHCSITGFKARARGKPIIIDLPKNSPSVRAIAWLLDAGKRLANAAVEDTDRLFLIHICERVQLMPSHWFTNWFKTFAASTPGLDGIRLVPNMIRPSVLLHASLSNDGRLRTGMAIGQHSTPVTQGYQQKWPTRLLYDSNIRRFQQAFETLVLSNVKDAAAHLDITVEQFQARLGQLAPTGLGTFCKDSRGKPGESTNGTCSSLDCWNECPNLLIVAEVEAVATLQLWQASLRSAQPAWERDRAERWDAVWLPWLCLTDVVEEKMSRGPLLKLWNSARIRGKAISAQPDYVKPQPW